MDHFQRIVLWCYKWMFPIAWRYHREWYHDVTLCMPFLLKRNTRKWKNNHITTFRKWHYHRIWQISRLITKFLFYFHCYYSNCFVQLCLYVELAYELSEASYSQFIDRKICHRTFRKYWIRQQTSIPKNTGSWQPLPRQKMFVRYLPIRLLSGVEKLSFLCRD